MAYQNLLAGRIYLNVAEFLALKGVIQIDNLFRTLPVKLQELPQPLSLPSMGNYNLFKNEFIAVLGHTYYGFNIKKSNINLDDTTDIINGMPGSCMPGFSITGLPEMPDELWANGSAGSVILGTYFDFSTINSPDLNLSLTYEYADVDEITTKGGSTLTNSHYTPNMWGSRGAWEFDEGHEIDHRLSFNGRRVWDLSFSYLSDSSIFPKDISLTNLESVNYDESNIDANTILTDDTFLKVIHLTNGGQLPFIFQIDSTEGESKGDQFAIAKFDMNSFKFSQVANSAFNIKIRIKEIF